MTVGPSLLVVFDLDGTLADVEHRRHHVTGGNRRWDAFFAAAKDDPPVAAVIAAFHAMKAAGHEVQVWSGRSDAVRADTEAWLERHGLQPDRLIMRRARDNTPDDVLKESWLDAADRKPDLVFDDRDKVVAMWRRRGVPCFQVAPGDF
ncbi:HAD family hydrolase [Parvularcula dongshanensis]|uniref:Phosphoglycolate phosphatase-like HAD superfamily hydrolase n=1 Tax=Parvularcula dongshanensis TaxID=1173995 RepID=A0A840I5A1_9PROT|nr:HAD family hydrolase [Parvularcula dongshanensis]MBB4660019.1 phosphoglycolate phosphatase-like HAD superfamily hydrolase [Parvularcula dongshanensis]